MKKINLIKLFQYLFLLILFVTGIFIFQFKNEFYYSRSSFLGNEKKFPINLTIPSINVNAKIIPIGITKDGKLDAPDNIEDVGWYASGSIPGEIGNSVMDGHYGKIRSGFFVKKGVFEDLEKLQIGDKLYVQNMKGENLIFIVRDIRLYNENEDSSEVFKSKDAISHLNLITCNGLWDEESKTYTKRLVVFTDLLN